MAYNEAPFINCNQNKAHVVSDNMGWRISSFENIIAKANKYYLNMCQGKPLECQYHKD